MRPVLAFIVASSLSTGAAAQAGPVTLDMTCAQAAGLVRSRGAVVLRTGSATYDRFVRDESFCAGQETARPSWVRTADSAQCPVGGVCRLREID